MNTYTKGMGTFIAASAVLATCLATTSHVDREPVYPYTVGPAASVSVKGHPAPAPYTSWRAQVHAQSACTKVDHNVDDLWENCLQRVWKTDTKATLSYEEFETNAVKNTWKVSWSHVVLPSGGKVMTKAQKAKIGQPSSVYCKSYSTTIKLCNNGFRI